MSPILWELSVTCHRARQRCLRLLGTVIPFWRLGIDQRKESAVIGLQFYRAA
jgi:hypothetical protein